MSAGKFFSSSNAAATSSQQIPLGDQGATTGGDAGAVRAPDISSLTPEQRADRLFNRVMLLSKQGKTDSVLFFAPMAISAYQLLTPMSVEQRYEMGRVAEVAGALPFAKAQADTILSSTPNNLLGLVLASRVASLSGDSVAMRQYRSKLLAAEKPELQKKLPEYDRHQDDITAALADARGTSR
jgi:hypothetical protein